ncbi:MAG: YfcE family phosphodiesterase [Chloroflexi bacterium]|nr:YfcE family phosphodiesterase [Chloroflexota bacterium]
MRIGLISDTHMPRRLKTLPPIVAQVFATCDLILHAGDVGELWVLDQLSQSAPVIAVHGNDETVEATNALPFLQTLAIAGHRLVLTHSHNPDRHMEMEQRKDDTWPHKLQYRANYGKAHGAKIVIWGHTHIPMQVEHDGVLLINPGAIASGGPWTKQILQTVAVLTLTANTAPQVQFINLQTGGEYIPDIDWNTGFAEQIVKTNERIFTDEFFTLREWFMQAVYPLAPDYLEDAIFPLCHEVWEGNRKIITVEDVAAALTASGNTPAEIMTLLRQNETLAPYLHS